MTVFMLITSDYLGDKIEIDKLSHNIATYKSTLAYHSSMVDLVT